MTTKKNGKCLSLAIFVSVFSLIIEGQGQTLHISSSHIDFKELFRENEEVRQQFEIANSGDKNLIIEKVKSSCECVGYKMGKSVLAPGETTAMEVVFKPRNAKMGGAYSIYLITNDKTSPLSRVEVRSDVVAILEIEPKTVQFDYLSEGDKPRDRDIRKLYIVNLARVPIEGVKVRSLTPYISVDGCNSNTLGNHMTNSYDIVVDARCVPAKSISGFVSIEGTAGGRRITSTVRVLIKRDNESVFSPEQAGEAQRDGWSLPSENIVFTYSKKLKGYNEIERLIRVLSCTDEAISEVVATCSFPHVKCFVDQREGRNYMHQISIMIDSRYIPQETEYGLLRVRARLGNRAISKCVSVKIESRE